jgi:hypothetical protein
MASQGPGSISGTISTENGRAGAANVPVILRATETEEFYMTYSGSDGTFQFTGLDLAAYEIFAEVPGKSITPQAIVLDELHTSVSGIEMLIMQTQIIFVGAGITDVFETAPVIYPNPVKNQLNVAIDPVQPVIVMISITDLVGRTILREEHEINSAETMVLDVSRLAKGIYSLTITGLDASITEKIIK